MLQNRRFQAGGRQFSLKHGVIGGCGGADYKRSEQRASLCSRYGGRRPIRICVNEAARRGAAGVPPVQALAPLFHEGSLAFNGSLIYPSTQAYLPVSSFSYSKARLLARSGFVISIEAEQLQVTSGGEWSSEGPDGQRSNRENDVLAVTRERESSAPLGFPRPVEGSSSGA